MEIYICFSMKQAGFLLMNGCRLIALEPSRQNAGFNNFIFKKTDKLKELLDKYHKEYSINKNDE